MAPAATTDDDERAAPSSCPRLQLLPSPVFPIAVIGLGLIGSAACRHLSQALLGSGSLLAIGPPEPAAACWQTHQGPFASHYDQGRLTRITDPDPVWAALAARSMARYQALELDSGIAFHHPVGSLRVDYQPGLRQSFQAGEKNGAVQELAALDGAALGRAFPFFHFDEAEAAAGAAAIVERGGAGYINPRSMVSAQLGVAQKNGACIVREAVKHITPTADGVRISTSGGGTLLAKKVVVCAGSYSSFLVPPRGCKDQTLDLRTYGRTVVLAEVEEGGEEEQRLAKMPTFIWRLRGNKQLKWIYGCPPTKYPDGSVALKVGGTMWEAPEVGRSEADLAAWFAGGARARGRAQEEESAALESALLCHVMPGFKPTRVRSKPCVVSFTAHKRPYIDAADGLRSPASARVFVAAGGCGAAAKSSDEIGRIAAELALTGRWDSDLDPTLFKAVFKSKART